MGRITDVHLQLLSTWRHVTNLVGPGPLEPHVEDSVAALRDAGASGRWVDLGSGAGFPGLILADLFPDLHVDLVEPRARRAAFLQAVVDAAGIGDRVAVRRERAERLPATWDGAVARALAPPPTALDLTLHRLRPGGRAVLLLGPEGPVPEHPEARLFHVEHYRIGDRSRRVATWTRVTPPSR